MVNKVIETKALTIVRGGRSVLTDLTCSMPSGHITGLLGPSGCGKSTLIRSVVGVQRALLRKDPQRSADGD